MFTLQGVDTREKMVLRWIITLQALRCTNIATDLDTSVTNFGSGQDLDSSASSAHWLRCSG